MMRSHSRIRRAILSTWLVLGLAAAFVAIPAEAERSTTTPTGWGWFTSGTETQINDFVDDTGTRLIDIEVLNNDPRFAASLVHNSGPHARPSWHWYYDLTFSELTQMELITSGDERPLDIESYMVGGARRYAVVTVNNQGSHEKGWGWHFGVTKSYIADHLQGVRIVDLDRQAGTSKYNMIVIANQGADASAWWYYYSRTPAQIADKLDDKNARLIDIERDGSGKFTVVMVKNTGKKWWWFHGKTGAGAAELANQYGTRVIDVERYEVDGKNRYVVILLNNVNSVTSNARDIMRPLVQKAAFGFYLKQVGGPVYASLQENKVFEPASTLKALHHLTAMLAVQAPNAPSLGTNVTWYARPGDASRYPGTEAYKDDKNKCAYTAEGVAQTSVDYVDDLEVILQQMMEQSDNRTTDAVWNMFGQAAINDVADDLNMDDTHLNHRIGCPGASSPQPFKSNELTLHDAGLLYEGVANGSLLGDGEGSAQEDFYRLMLNDPSGWKDVVDDVADQLNKSQTIANQFLDAMETAVKGGSYNNGADCPQGVSGICNTIRRTGFGVLSLPVENGVRHRHYVYGSFVDGFFKCGTTCKSEEDDIGKARSQAQKAIMRPRIVAAMQTWE